MKTISITIPIELDHRAAAEARRRGISKSELIRMGLAEVLPEAMAEVDTSSSTADYFRERAGFAQEGDREEPNEVDRVVYKL